MNAAKKNLFGSSEDNSLLNEKKQLIAEVNKAKQEWLIAQQKLNYVLEEDQIDYAIYALEAAEKRYEMLLRQAKKLKVDVLEVDDGG